MKNWIAILDFGSQYTHLIARRIRECGVYSEIVPYNIRPGALLEKRPAAIILSGGPASVISGRPPVCNKGIFRMGVPVLGICYGAQLMSATLGGGVKKAKKREYGKALLKIRSRKTLMSGLGTREIVWMSHADRINRLPSGFRIIASTPNSRIAAMEDPVRLFYGLQFHPEVTHTPNGTRILKNFIFRIAHARTDWSMRRFVKEQIKNIRQKAGREKILCALSGGVDSSVLAMLLKKAIGKKLIAVFIDNGLLRKNETGLVKERFGKHYKMNVKIVNASRAFLRNLRGVRSPEKKRRIIGRTFIEVFTKEAGKLGRIKYLAQGTLYPDVIESVSAFGGPSATIKTHHNVGGLPKDMKFDLIEPFRFLFKDEVRLVGKELGMPDDIVYRQPFPGPGLAVRILGEVTKDKLEILRQADRILLNEIKRAGLYRRLWQSFCVLLPLKTVGVKGDERTYENMIAIRAVESADAMTARWARLPYDFLENISSRIVNEVTGVNRVVYDISSKPPATIEWE